MKFQDLKNIFNQALQVVTPLELKLLEGTSTGTYAGAITAQPPEDTLRIIVFASATQREAASKNLQWEWYDNGNRHVLGYEAKAQDVRSYLYAVIGADTPLICTRNSYLRVWTDATAGQKFWLNTIHYDVDGLAVARALEIG